MGGKSRSCERTVRDLEGLGGKDAAAAEGLRLEARDARLEGGVGLGAADGVRNLLFWCESHIQRELRNNSPSVRKDSARADSASHTCGGMISMLGVTP